MRFLLCRHLASKYHYFGLGKLYGKTHVIRLKMGWLLDLNKFPKIFLKAIDFDVLNTNIWISGSLNTISASKQIDKLVVKHCRRGSRSADIKMSDDMPLVGNWVVLLTCVR